MGSLTARFPLGFVNSSYVRRAHARLSGNRLLTYTRGSDRSRARKQAVSLKYATVDYCLAGVAAFFGAGVAAFLAGGAAGGGP